MVDFQDVLLPDENIHGINIRVNPPEVIRTLTLEEAKGMLHKMRLIQTDILRHLNKAFKEEKNDKMMKEYFKKAEHRVQQDLAATMNYIQPIGFEIQIREMPKFGFEASYKGLVQCCEAIRLHRQDFQILRLKQKVAENFIPHWYRQVLPDDDD